MVPLAVRISESDSDSETAQLQVEAFKRSSTGTVTGKHTNLISRYTSTGRPALVEVPCQWQCYLLLQLELQDLIYCSSSTSTVTLVVLHRVVLYSRRLRP
jgi:hypothetical protein